MHLLGHDGLRFVQTLNDEEQEECTTCAGLFLVLSEKFKLQHNETVLSLQYWTLTREENKNAEEWISHLRLKSNY